MAQVMNLPVERQTAEKNAGKNCARKHDRST
jgi:hypothetical protein